VQLDFFVTDTQSDSAMMSALDQGGAHFGHLTRLRTLELDSQVGGAGAAGFNARLAGLPPSLQRLSLQARTRCSCWLSQSSCLLCDLVDVIR